MRTAIASAVLCVVIVVAAAAAIFNIVACLHAGGTPVRGLITHLNA